jgi:ribosome-associated toxin RatA of RatAB toxin-antitoxin module
VATVRTVNTIVMKAPAERIFDLAAEVEAWPALLSHYRYVRVVRGPSPPVDGVERIVTMSARRTGIPVCWSSTQTVHRVQNEVRYHHVAGVTRGMDVVWTMAPRGKETVVRIDHELESPRRWLRNPVMSFIVGRVFVMHVAERTLRGIKRAAESETRRGQRA